MDNNSLGSSETSGSMQRAGFRKKIICTFNALGQRVASFTTYRHTFYDMERTPNAAVLTTKEIDVKVECPRFRKCEDCPDRLKTIDHIELSGEALVRQAQLDHAISEGLL